MRGSLILYLKGMRIMMFQLSGFYCKGSWTFWGRISGPRFGTSLRGYRSLRAGVGLGDSVEPLSDGLE